MENRQHTPQAQGRMFYGSGQVTLGRIYYILLLLQMPHILGGSPRTVLFDRRVSTCPTVLHWLTLMMDFLVPTTIDSGRSNYAY